MDRYVVECFPEVRILVSGFKSFQMKVELDSWIPLALRDQLRFQ